MNKKVTAAIILGTVGLVTMIGIKIYRKRKGLSNSLDNSVGPMESSSTVDSKPRFPLQRGSGIGSKSYQMNDVKLLQAYLNKISPTPLLPLVVDGKFGSKTESRLFNLVKVKSIDKDFFKKTL
jgi:hypothetical protein